MEHVKEHSDAEASKSINQRGEQRYRRNQAPQDIEEGGDEPPHHEGRDQNRAEQCQQRRIFECHDESMNIASAVRNSSYDLGTRQSAS
jgi:hypothetical protein